MKKVVIICLLLSLFVISQNIAKASAYSNNSNIISGTIGLGLRGSYGDINVPPVTVMFERQHKVDRDIPLSYGGFAGYASGEDKITFGNQYIKHEYQYIVFGGRCSYHFANQIKNRNVDVYVGGSLGYAYVDSETSTSSGMSSANYSADGSYLLFGLHVGGRYFFTNNLAGMVELGFTTSYIQAGISYKM